MGSTPYRRRIVSATGIVALSALAALSGGSCGVPTGADGSGSDDVEFEIEYCEEDGRGGLQDDRCTDDPGRYRDGEYTGNPYPGGGQTGGGDRNGGR